MSSLPIAQKTAAFQADVPAAKGPTVLYIPINTKSMTPLGTSRFHHKRINHGKAFANDKNYINGIANFTASSEEDACLL